MKINQLIYVNLSNNMMEIQILAKYSIDLNNFNLNKLKKILLFSQFQNLKNITLMIFRDFIGLYIKFTRKVIMNKFI
jgi:hypothetical protein